MTTRQREVPGRVSLFERPRLVWRLGGELQELRRGDFHRRFGGGDVYRCVRIRLLDRNLQFSSYRRHPEGDFRV